MRCQTCGGTVTSTGVCGACGRPQAPPPPGSLVAGMPQLLWLPIGAFALTALVHLILFVVALSEIEVIWAALCVVVVAGAVTAALRLPGGRPAARAMSLVGAGLFLVASVLLPDLRSIGSVLLGVVCAAAAAPLAVVPDLRAYFARPTDRPTSIVVARVVLCVYAVVTALSAAFILVGAVVVLAASTSASRSGGELGAALGGLGGFAGGMALVLGFVAGGLAAFLFWARIAVSAANRVARILVTIAVGLHVMLLMLSLVTGTVSGGPVLGLLLHVVVIGALWLPADARAHFGEPPLDVVTQVHRAVVGMVPAAAPHGPPPARPAGPRYGAAPYPGAPYPGPSSYGPPSHGSPSYPPPSYPPPSYGPPSAGTPWGAPPPPYGPPPHR